MPNKRYETSTKPTVNTHYDTGDTRQAKPEEVKEPCVTFVTDQWEQWDSHWSGRLNDFEGYYDRWIGVPPKRDESWQAQFHKRLTWQAEKTLVSRFHSALFPTSAPIDVDSTEVQDELQGILGKSIVAHWFKIGMFSKEFLSGMRTAGIYGTGLFEDGWYLRVELKTGREDVETPDYRSLIDEQGNAVLDEQGNVRTQQIGTKKTKREVSKYKVVEDRYRVRKANIFAWRVHPNKLSDDDDFPVIKQEFVTYDQLLEKQVEQMKHGLPGFDNMDILKKERFKIKEEEARRLSKGGDYTDKDDPRIELLHFYGLYTDDEEKNPEKKPMWLTIANRRYRLRKIGNPFWHRKPPLFHIIWTEDEKPSYYGIGIAQIGGDAEDRANTNVNTRTDILKKGARREGWYNALDKKIKKSQLTKNMPGFMKSCSDVDKAVRYDEAPSLRPEDYKEEETAVNDHKEITGAVPSMQPTADVKEQHKTMGGMQLLLGQAIQRLKPDLQMMEMMGIRRIANRGFLLTMQYFDKPKAIELVASQDELKRLGLEKIYTLKPGQIIGKLNFFCTGLSESVEKAQNIDRLMRYMEITAKVPPMMQVTNYANIGKRIALWLGFEDVEDFVMMNPQDPMQAQHSSELPVLMQKIQQQQQQLAQQQQALQQRLGTQQQGLAQQQQLQRQATGQQGQQLQQLQRQQNSQQAIQNQQQGLSQRMLAQIASQVKQGQSR